MSDSGSYVDSAHPANAIVTEILFDRMDAFPYIYICGVGAGKEDERWRTNLHFPLRYEAGAVAETLTDSDYRFVAENAVALPIPEPPVERTGLTPEHYRCKNFRFGVAYFGASGTAGLGGSMARVGPLT